jgi:cytochrome c biogenesis protein CcmG/thiol:disulfide interchange protein DsbE
VRKLLLALGLVAVVVVVVVGLGQAGGDDGTAEPPASMSREEVEAPLPGQPAALAQLHARSGELVDGGLDRFEEELRDLRGTPVVVNLWASWCGPCRFEIPFIQRQFREHGTKVAFLGVNSDDSDDGARRMARELPMPYPSVVDPRAQLAGSLGARGLPVTVFYDANGKRVYVHQGSYRDEEQLADDIAEYAS